MINLKPITFTLGLTLSKLALFMWLPTLLAFSPAPQVWQSFWRRPSSLTLPPFCLHWGHKSKFRLGVRDMFVLTSAVWAVTCVFGALPFVFINQISFTDAYFETMSGVTTTGSTVLSGLDTMAPSILLWRSLLQWLGGIGFIVLAVAVLPALNVGGMKLFQTESSDKSDKDSPRATNVAKNIVLVYLVLSTLCCISYWLSGMTLFEAINHAMTTLSTGLLHFRCLDGALLVLGTGGDDLHVFGRTALPAVCPEPAPPPTGPATGCSGARFLLASAHRHQHDEPLDLYIKVFSLPDAIRISMFNIVSVLTTTGYGLTDFGVWTPFTTVLFVFLLLVGACSGSTAGGLKIFRIQIAATLFHKQARQLMHQVLN